MSAEKRKKTRASFMVRKDLFDTFTSLIKRLNLRRDTFLCDVLRGEIEELERIPANSEKGREFLEEKSGRGMVLEIEGASFVKANLNLDTSLAARINVVCGEKRVPRDIFIESFLDFLVKGSSNGLGGPPLVMAAALLEDPRSQYVYSDGQESAYSELSVSDDAVDAWWANWHEKSLVAEAVSKLKGVAYGTAERKLQELSEEDQAKLARHPDVREMVEKLRGSKSQSIDLLSYIRND